MECNFENCGYYVDEECIICGMGTDGEDTFCKYCKDNPNCYYKKLTELKAENERLKKENEILLGQLVINDGEDITVQISKSQFDEYNKYRHTLQEIKKILLQAMDVKSNAYNHFLKVEQAIDLITKAEEE